MSPSPSISNVADQPHRNVEPFGKRLTDAMPPRGEKNLSHLPFGEFGLGHLLALSADPSRSGAPVGGAPPHLFRRLARIVVFAGKLGERFGSVPASISSAVPLAVRAILFCCRPIEVSRTIIGLVAANVRAVFLIWRARPVEGFADKAMNRAADRLSIRPEADASIASYEARANDAPLVFALPIRHRTANSPIARYLVIGGF